MEAGSLIVGAHKSPGCDSSEGRAAAVEPTVPIQGVPGDRAGPDATTLLSW